MSETVRGTNDQAGINGGNSHQILVVGGLLRLRVRNRTWWLRITVYTLFVLFGQSAATLLGRLYFNKGGKSIWLTSLTETVGFPLLIPFSFYFSPNKTRNPSNTTPVINKPPTWLAAAIFVFLGLLQAADSFLYTIGLLYLPVSTFSLLSATQLAFNAFFAFFLNAQSFSPFILNSLFLLTISAVLLVLQTDSENPTGSVSKRNTMLGFISTIMASALYSLGLSLTQLAFEKVLKEETYGVVLKMIIHQSLVATCVTLVALFASEEWRILQGEMEVFELGKEMYVILIIWIVLSWQIMTIGSVGLIFEVSSLFSNVINTLALPIIPMLAVVFFNDKMNGVKVISTLLAVWGFASYVYQHYLDESQCSSGSNYIELANNVSSGASSNESS